MTSKGITERGYGGKKSTNPTKPESRSQEPDRLPSIADQDPAGNKITTNYPVRESSNKTAKNSGGREIENQKLRGYVLNEKDIGIGQLDNGNARRGSPPTIRKISEP